MTDTEPKLTAVEAAAAAGRRDDLEANQVRVKGGLVLTFKELTCFDNLQIQKEAKMPASKLVDEDPWMYGLLVAWRAAVNGGHEVPFEQFAKEVPQRQFAELAEVALGAVGNGD